MFLELRNVVFLFFFLRCTCEMNACLTDPNIGTDSIFFLQKPIYPSRMAYLDLAFSDFVLKLRVKRYEDMASVAHIKAMFDAVFLVVPIFVSEAYTLFRYLVRSSDRVVTLVAVDTFGGSDAIASAFAMDLRCSFIFLRRFLLHLRLVFLS